MGVEYDYPLLSLITFAPLVGGLVILLFLREKTLARWGALISTLISLSLTLVMLRHFDPSGGGHLGSGYQFLERLPWIPQIGVEYHLGVDGLSVTLVLLTSILTPLAVLASWNIKDRTHMYMFFFLLLQTGMYGVFTALNFFHWFIFWELGLVPMFFLIKLWGGEDRDYASFKFFIYTMFGSVFMLLAFQAIYMSTRGLAGPGFSPGTGVFDFVRLAEMVKPDVARISGTGTSLGTYFSYLLHRWGLDMDPTTCGVILFFAVALGFAVKVPIWPLHTWLPDTHTQAPTAGSMMLAGVLLKMGAYGFLRIVFPLFPEESARFAPLLICFALFSIVFGAFAAMAQQDLKRLVAYSSVNHMGYCMLGVFAVAHTTGNAQGVLDAKNFALSGAILQMFNHGITAAACFFLVGVIYERAHTRDLHAFGGLRHHMPVYAGIMGIATFSSLGLPFLNGFVSEFMVFRGVFAVFPLITILSAIGLVVTAIYLLRMIQLMFLGPPNEKYASIPDMDSREIVIAAPMLALMIAIGVWPGPLLNLANKVCVELVGMF